MTDDRRKRKLDNEIEIEKGLKKERSRSRHGEIVNFFRAKKGLGYN